MNGVRRCAEFMGSFPDDTVWNDDETAILQTGGKAVTEAVAGLLAEFGCLIEDVNDDLEHSWVCEFSYEGLALEFRTYSFDPYMVIFAEPFRASPSYPLFLHVLLRLNGRMRQDGRFGHLIWYDEDRGVKAEGADLPFDGEVPPLDEIKSWRRRRHQEKRLGFLEKLLVPLKRRSEDGER